VIRDLASRAGIPLLWRAALVLAAATLAVAELQVPWEQPAGFTPPALTGSTDTRRPQTSAAADYPAIAEHPLLYPSRAPWAPPPSPPPTAPQTMVGPPGDWILVGVVVSGPTRSAIVKLPNFSKTSLVSEGDTLDGWRLSRIDATGLRFEADGQSFDLGFPNDHRVRR
jgi:hypothetical protein